MIGKLLACGLALFSPAGGVGAGQKTPTPRKQVYFWVWWQNLEGRWRDYVDFAADHGVDGVVIWGLQGWKGDGGRCREVVAHAHRRGLKVIHGLGLNGYEVGRHVVLSNPRLAAKLPPALAKTPKGRATLQAVFCPSQPQSLELLKSCLLRAAGTGIDGFNFETADVDFITCHCPQCVKRFGSADETAHGHKPIGWPIAHLRFAADVLAAKHPRLWLTCEFAMQRFGRPPYADCPRIRELNRRIDPRMTVVWAEATAPPEAICRRLRAERENVGFYIRSGAIRGWQAKRVLAPEALLPLARRLLALDPVCVLYRSYRPLDRWAVNMAAAARILRQPGMGEADLARTIAKARATTRPGERYSFVRRIAPGNLIAPGTRARVSVSSGEALRLVDGVAEADEGIWRTERNSPKQAWAIAAWPDRVTLSRIRLYHQSDGHYRSLDYTLQHERDGKWQDLAGMPVRNNPVHGWAEHTFGPLQTRRLRLLITRSRHGNRMGMGEWEVYGPTGGK